MPEDISAALAKKSGASGKTAHTELDLTDQNVIQGAHGTVAEQQDETHYDKRRANEDDDECMADEKGKIRFPQDGKVLYGRDKELHELKEIYQQVAPKQKSPVRNGSCVVFLSGLSGTGKSALVDELVRTVTTEADSDRNLRPLFGSGKFVQFGTSAPFSALNEVLTSWSSDLLERGGKELRRVRSNILKAGVGPTDEGSAVLRGMFPCLTPVLSDVKNDENKTLESERRVSTVSMDALKVVLQIFLTALCRKQDRPVIMFIDDLQWADEASLEVLSSLLTSKCVEHFLFIGAYRSDEVNSDDHPFRKQMKSIIAALNTDDSDGIVRNMEIFNLSHKDVCQFISDTIEKDDPADVSSLTDIVYEKTMGNIFFVKQALEELVRRNVLYFDIICYEWQWNLNMTEEIESFVNKSSCLDMVKSKVETLGKVQQRALTLAAYTRNLVDVGTLQRLLESDGITLDLDSVTSLLDAFVEEGLLLKCENTLFAFAHDLILEGARARVADGKERTHILVQIASVLSGLSSSSMGQDWMLFVAVDHFNSVPREYIDASTSLELTKLASLNLRASKLASAKAALSKANEYLRAGVSYLPTDESSRWQNYELCLDMYNCLLQSEASFGNYDEAEAGIDEVLRNAKNESDKCAAYLAQIKVSAEKGERDYSLGAKKGCEILCLPFPPGKKDILREQMQLRIKKRNRPLAALLKMPIVEDDYLRMRIKLYSTTQEFANLSQNSLLTKLVELRALKDAYTHGCVGPEFAQSLANSAVGLVKEGKYQKAFGYANLAINIMNRSPDADSAWIRLKLKFGVLQLRHPFKEDISDCAELYKRLISGGSVSEGMGCALTSAQAYYAAGLPLNSMWATQLLLYEKAARDFGKDSFALLFQVNRQFLINLSGKAKNCNPTVFSGEAFNEEEALAPLEGNPRSMALRDISTLRIQLAYIFCDEPTLDEMVERLSSYPLSDMMVARQHLRLSFLGLAILTERTEKGGKKEHAKTGQQILKLFQTLDRNGSPNAHPLYLCLRAVNKMSATAFDKAIEACSDAGMQNLEAVMSERCGMFLQTQGDVEKMKTYLTNALRLYNSWGSHAKVSQLRDRYDFLLDVKLHRAPTVAESSAGNSVISY